MRARNSIGFSDYSSPFTIVAATIPSQPEAPTVVINSEYEIGISWNTPSDLGGLLTSGYKLEIKTTSSTFEQDLANCDAENNASIINSRSCTVPVSVLRTNPYDLLDAEPIYVRLTAINNIGSSPVSSESSSVLMPIADVRPDPPTTFIRNEVLTTKSQVAFSWNAPAFDGGDTIIDYAIEMDDNNDNSFTEVETGVTSTSHIQSGLAAG